MSTESSVKVLTINPELPSTNKELLIINISATEEDKVMKIPLSLTTYSCYSVVLA